MPIIYLFIVVTRYFFFGKKYLALTFNFRTSGTHLGSYTAMYVYYFFAVQNYGEWLAYRVSGMHSLIQ